MPQVSGFGIYVTPKENVAVRITSPYWFAEPPEWVFLTPEANVTILAVRKLAGEKKLSATPDAIVWAPLPLKE